MFRPTPVLFLAGLALLTATAESPAADAPLARAKFDADIPNDALKAPFKDQAPLLFVTRGGSQAEWSKLPAFWNEGTEEALDPVTGEKVTRRVVRIKVPLGLNTPPALPTNRTTTVAEWELGKRLFFDKTLSTDNSVACSSCHNPAKGFTDQRKTSLGISAKVGGINAPTVINSAFNKLQFWDGRAAGLEDQAQGPVGNPSEMFGGKADAPPGAPWDEAVARLRLRPEYVAAFEKVFGHAPTRDAAAKAIATYERTVLVGNSLHDRAELAMRKRVSDEETGKFEFTPEDYAQVVKDAFAAKDERALKAHGLDPAGDAGKAAEIGKKLANGRALFFNKARCATCHVGDNFTDNLFHNLGVGVVDGKLPETEEGRYAQLPTGHKDPSQMGAFKTPGLRALLDTAPYMHSGEEKTLEAVVDFYDRGGNANEFLDAKMRDTAAEDAYLKAKAAGREPTGPKPAVFTRGGRPIIPFKLNLTPDEKADLVLFLKALQGDPVDPIVADPDRFPSSAKTASR